MRKPYTLFILLCLSFALMCLSSCSIRGTIGSSFNTRKYTPGYYFNIAGNKQKTASYTRVNKVTSRPGIAIVKSVLPEVKETEINGLISNTSSNSKTPVGSIAQQTSSKRNFSVLSTELRAINDKTKGDHDWADQERKDRSINIILALISIAAGIGGIALMFSNFGVGVALVVIGAVLSVLGLKRGSSTILTFIGFIISVVGLIILIDYVLVNGV